MSLTKVTNSMISGAYANVLDFGAVADNTTDCSPAIQDAMDSLGATGGTVFIPAGTYFCNTTLSLPTNVVLKGCGRGNTILRGAGATMTATVSAPIGSGAGVIGIYMPGHNSEIVALTVKDFGCGIYMKEAYWSKVYLSRMTNCRMGLRCDDSYISSVFENNIDYNKFNVVMENQNYQLTFYTNDVDNQIQFTVGGQTVRGPGMFVTGDNGSVIRDNTIEANSADICAGVILHGLSQRTVIAGNWFEQNGSGIYSTDIAVGLPNNAYGAALASSCPPEYSVTAPTGTTSNVSIHDNSHYASKTGILCTFFFSTLNISIANEVFVGVKGRNNQPVLLFTESLISQTTIRIDNCTVFNSADNSIDAEMLSGIQNSYVFTGVGFNNYAYGATLLDGKDLFTKEMSMYDFSQLPGATLSCSWAAPTSGTATATNDVRCAIGTIGVRSVIGTGRARVTTAGGSTTVVPTGAPIYGIALKVFNGITEGLSYEYSAGTSAISRTDGRYFDVQLMNTPTTSTSTYFTGDYFGYCFMSVANYNTNFAGATRLVLTDLTVYGIV